MRSTILTLVTSLAIVASAPDLLANKTNLPSGTLVEFVGTGGTRKVTISGTKGCTFQVMAMSSDESVATVTMSDGSAKKHTVVIEAVGVGEAEISIVTSSGSIPQCQGFFFDYPVTVEYDASAFLKNGKSLLKDTTKLAKTDTADLFDIYCDLLADLTAQVAGGSIDVDEAYFQAAALLGEFQDGIDALLDEIYEQAWDDLWDNEAQFLAPDADILSFYPGACGEMDRFAGALSSLQHKLESASYKKFKSITKALIKSAQGDDVELLTIALFGAPSELEIDEPVLLPGAPPEEELPSAPVKNLAKTWTSAGRLSSSSTSRLEIGGVADPGAGAVTVTIVGPAGFTTNVEVAVGDDCTWKASFAGLTPGPYTASLVQGANGPVGFGTPVP